LCRIALQRPAIPEEAEALRAFLREAGAEGPVQAAQAVLAGNGFVWVD